MMTCPVSAVVVLLLGLDADIVSIVLQPKVGREVGLAGVPKQTEIFFRPCSFGLFDAVVKHVKVDARIASVWTMPRFVRAERGFQREVGDVVSAGLPRDPLACLVQQQ